MRRSDVKGFFGMISRHKKAALRAAFFGYVSDYASAMMITLIEVITSE
jgi:hypothetical protein